jgi:cardiolipin synthase
MATWREGNRVQLLENGEAFFPAVLAAIAGARREVLVETFILGEDKVGQALADALADAARRGVDVRMMVDDYGTPALSQAFLERLGGVQLRMFDPRPRLFGMRVNLFRRLHRKLVVVDGTRAFIGGINFSADHLADFGPEAKQDYAASLEGPIVADILSFVRAAFASDGTGERWRHPRDASRPRRGDASVRLVLRDNGRRGTAIEDAYRRAIRAARSEILIANAYFFPGYGFVRELRRAARRGVAVSLLLQGEPDTPAARIAARLLYRPLIEAGVRIHEYCQRPFHGKVAVIDGEWATVGSSNLDPLSLALNLEANVFVRDRAFACDLQARLQLLQAAHCRPVEADSVPGSVFGDALLRPLVFHCLRRFPSWAGLLPAHTPRTVAIDKPRDHVGKAA